MARDSSLAARQAVIIRLKDHEAVAALVAERVHRSVQERPVWPYLRYGVDTWRPGRASGIDGMTGDVVIHAFATGETDDDCRALSAAVALALDGFTVDIADLAGFPARLDMWWTETQVLSDIGRADGWHGIVRFGGRVVS